MPKSQIENLAGSNVALGPGDEEVRDMLLAVLRVLVDQTDNLELSHVASAEGSVFRVCCAKDDVGKIIGKSGRTARAIRILLSASAAKMGRRYSLDIAQGK